MKYNSKYDRWVTNGGLVYRYDKKDDKLVLCRLTDSYGYLQVRVSKPKNIILLVHRLVYETFVGEIPNGYELDHINTIRDDNRLENLRLVTHKENMNNTLTLEKIKDVAYNKRNKASSDFGKKYTEHFGFGYHKNIKQYSAEWMWYRRHNNKCRWE